MGIISNGNTVIDNGSISANEVDTTQLASSAVETAKINNDAVTADKLAHTSVTAGSYTTADITVDAQGRITAASSGSAGGGGFTAQFGSSGPASGTYTANASATEILIYATSGGGGGGGGGFNQGSARNGTPGGMGAFAAYSKSISAPFAQPYAVGAGGNPGNPGPNNPGNPGSAGGTTSLANVFNISGGNGGQGAFNNSPASQPGNPGSVSNSPTPAKYSVTNRFGGRLITGGVAGSGGLSTTVPGTKGEDGGLVIFENV